MWAFAFDETMELELFDETMELELFDETVAV